MAACRLIPGGADLGGEGVVGGGQGDVERGGRADGEGSGGGVMPGDSDGNIADGGGGFFVVGAAGEDGPGLSGGLRRGDGDKAHRAGEGLGGLGVELQRPGVVGRVLDADGDPVAQGDSDGQAVHVLEEDPAVYFDRLAGRFPQSLESPDPVSIWTREWWGLKNSLTTERLPRNLIVSCSLSSAGGYP